MNILFVAFEFPPLNRGGVYRPLSFCKYLPQFGINPIVVTLAESSFKNVYENYSLDETLKKAIPSSATIIEVEAKKEKKASRMKDFMSIYFSIHGNEVNNWKDNFYKAIEEAIIKYKPLAILATVPPFSILPLVTKVSKQYKLPLILDFRDAWSQWKSLPYGSIFHYWLTLRQEKKYLNYAYAVITTSGQTLDDFKKIHSTVPQKKFHLIMNGYDGQLNEWGPLDIMQSTFTIGYVGSFYFTPSARVQMLMPWWKKRGHRMLQYIPHKQDWLYRSPYFFLKTISELKNRYPDIGKKIKVKFAGKTPDWLPAMIEEFNLTQQIELIGELSHTNSINFQQQCDALLITSAKQLDGKGDYSIAGKTFEYIQAQKPIIAFVCEGAQKHLMEETGVALICNPDDTEGSTEKIKNLINGTIHLTPNYDYISTLSRVNQAEQMAGIIKNVTLLNG